VDFYTSDVIVDAKKLLFSSVNTSRRLTSRKGDDKSINDLGDMLKVILELKGDGPQFVAHDLSNIPPVSINNFDILHLLRDIQDIKSQMNMLTNGHSDLSKCVKALTTNVAQQSTSMLPPPTPTTCEARPYVPPAKLTKSVSTSQPQVQLAVPVKRPVRFHSMFSGGSDSSSSDISSDSESSQSSVPITTPLLSTIVKRSHKSLTSGSTKANPPRGSNGLYWYT
jgi:hypothetical protein